MADERPTLRVSLIPEGGEVFAPVNTRGRVAALVVFCVFSLALVAASALYLKKLQDKNAALIKTLAFEMESVKAETSRLKEDYGQVSHLAKALSAAGALLGEHPSGGKILTLLEERTISGIYYSNLIASLDGKTLTLEARAKNFDDAARQIAAFREDGKRVERATMSAASADVSEDGFIKEIKFSLTLQLKAEAFK